MIEMFSLTGNPWWDVPLLIGIIFVSISFILNR